MNVNRTPGLEAAPPLVPDPSTNQKVAIPDGDSTQEQGVVEATEPLSPQMAALAKQRRALQAKERELADREKKLQEPRADAVDLTRIKTEPLSVLLEAGVTYDQLTEAILADQSGNSPELRKLQAKLAEMEQKVTKTFEDRDKQAEQAALAEMRKTAERLVREGDTYEMVRETGSVPLAIDLIERTYRETGEVMDETEALSLIEEELLERGTKLANLGKVRGKLAPEQPAQSPQQRPMTLTNRDTAQPPMSRKQRALAAFHGQLNK
jgi:hypothetical protein